MLALVLACVALTWKKDELNLWLHERNSCIYAGACMACTNTAICRTDAHVQLHRKFMRIDEGAARSKIIKVRNYAEIRHQHRLCHILGSTRVCLRNQSLALNTSSEKHSPAYCMRTPTHAVQVPQLPNPTLNLIRLVNQALPTSDTPTKESNLCAPPWQALKAMAG